MIKSMLMLVACRTPVSCLVHEEQEQDLSMYCLDCIERSIPWILFWIMVSQHDDEWSRGIPGMKSAV